VAFIRALGGGGRVGGRWHWGDRLRRWSVPATPHYRRSYLFARRVGR